MTDTYGPFKAFLAARRMSLEENARRRAEEDAARAAGRKRRAEEEDEEERRRRRRIPRPEYGPQLPGMFTTTHVAIPAFPFGDPPPGGGGGASGGDAGDGQQISVAVDFFRNRLLEPYWSPLAGDWEETDVLTHVGGAVPGVLMYNPTPVATTTRSDITLAAVSDGTQAVGVRLSFAGGLLSGYVLVAEAANHRLYRYDAGAPTLLRTYTGGILAGETVGILATGATIRGRKNGLMLMTVADATYASGFTGVVSFGVGASFAGFNSNV